jgi:PKD repeat protein
LAVGFTNTSTVGTTSRWDFGDGHLSSQRSPIRAYAQAGCYRVELIVFGNCGSDTSVQWVSVGGVQPCPVVVAQVLEEAGDLRLWPNPNTGRFSLRLPFVPSKPWSYALFNAQGQLLYQSADGLAQEQTVEHSELVPGLYWLRVQTERGETSLKWIRTE